MVIITQPGIGVPFINTKITKPITFFHDYLFDLIDLYTIAMKIIVANKTKKPDVPVNACNKEKPLLLKQDM
jgi:hypothetical protein